MSDAPSAVPPPPPDESAPAVQTHRGGRWWRWPLRLIAVTLILLSLLLAVVWAYSYSQEIVALRLPTEEMGTGRGLIAFDGTLVYKRAERILPSQDPWLFDIRSPLENGGIYREVDTPPPAYGLTWGDTRQGPGWYVGISLFLAVAVLLIMAAFLLLLARQPKPKATPTPAPTPVEEPRDDV